MKKVLLFALAVLVGTNAYAFGGGGSGRSSKRYEYGVNSFGIYRGGDKQVDIEFRECDSDTETLVERTCCPNNLIYSDNGNQKCCNQNGYMVKNGSCAPMAASATLTQNDDNFTFRWSQPGYVNGRITENAAGSWILYYNATSRNAEVHDYTLDSNGNLKETVWYPDSLEELENTPMKGETGNISSWLKDLLGMKKAMAWTANCAQGSSSYGYIYNGVCGGCANGSSPDSLGRCGFGTPEYQTISDVDKCVMEKGSWRFCACGGTLAKVGGQWTCSCPDGGSPSPGNYACCSADGYTYNTQTKAYDAIEAMYCGCPTGTRLVNQHFCCDADGYAVWGKNSKELSDVCLNDLCPNGGRLVENDTCCKNGMAYDENTGNYSVMSILCPCPSHGVRVGPACCRDGKGKPFDGSSVNYTVQFENPNYCMVQESTDWNQDGNIFTFNYKVYYPEDPDNLMAGSWTAVYDAETNTFTVTDYYRAANGELKTIVWHPTSFEEIENTPVKQGEDHAFLNKLKELFGVKSAVAAGTRAGSKDDKWSEFKDATNCYENGGKWVEGGLFSKAHCECPIQDSNGKCCEGETPQRKKVPSSEKYVCCPAGQSADDDGTCCESPLKLDSITKCCPDDKPALHVYYNNPIISAAPFIHSRGVCCPVGSILDEDNNCCPPGVGTVNGECCPESAPHPVEYYDKGGWRHYTCCPKNVYSADSDGNCSPACPEGEIEDPYGTCCKPENRYFSGYSYGKALYRCCPDSHPYRYGGHCCATKNCCDSSTEKPVRNYDSNGTYIGSICCDERYEAAINGRCCKGEGCCASDEFFSGEICCKIGQRAIRDFNWKEHCCDSDYSSVTKSGKCCKNDVTHYGDSCCPDDKPFRQGDTCCPWNSPGADSNGNCCAEDQHVVPYKTNHNVDGVVYNETRKACCDKSSQGVDKNGRCCPANSTKETATANSAGLCCAEGVIAKDSSGKCCPVGAEVNSSGECCPEGIKTDGAGACCSPELPQKVSLGGYSFCCAEGVVAVDSSGCCPPGASAKRSVHYPYVYSCCTEDKPKAFNVDYASDPVCCPAEAKGVDSQGNCCMGDTPVGGGARCCPADKPHAIPHTGGAVCCASDVSVVDINGKCCPPQTGLDDAGNCCPEDKPSHAYYEKNGKYHRICCPVGVLEWGGVDREGKCCPPNTGVNAAGICCPDGQPADQDGNCCPDGQQLSDDGYCCEGVVISGKCCPEGTKGLKLWDEGVCCPLDADVTEEKCCDDGRHPVTYTNSYGRKSKTCCPAGSGADKNGNCCPTGQRAVRGECCGAGEVEVNLECCSIFSLAVNNGETTCCASEEVVTYKGLEGEDTICCPKSKFAQENGRHICCDGEGKEVVGEGDNKQCCDSSKVAEKDGVKTCCTTDSEGNELFPTGEEGSKICCKEGEKNVNGSCSPECDSPMTWDSEKKKCMCPEGIEPTKLDETHQVCCKGGRMWVGTPDNAGYTAEITYLCGCAEGTPVNDGCCLSDNTWAFPSRTSRRIVASMCHGCPQGYGLTYVSKDGEEMCCTADGKGVEGIPVEALGTAELSDSPLCCSSGTYSETTGKCCQKDDNGNLTGHAMSGELDEGCCSAAGGHINQGKCCGSPGYLVDYTIDYEHCNCFDDNPPLEFKWDENSAPIYVCCAGKGFAYDDNGNEVPDVDACGCVYPDVDFGRKPGEHRMCCDEDYVAEYTDETGSHMVCCGTPASGWDYTIKGCCRDGGTLGKDGKTCCKDNQAWNASYGSDGGYNDVIPSACDCPYGTLSANGGCCSASGYYNNPFTSTGYGEINAEQCHACPEYYSSSSSDGGRLTYVASSDGSRHACCTEDGRAAEGDYNDPTFSDSDLCCPRADTSERCCNNAGGTWTGSSCSI